MDDQNLSLDDQELRLVEVLFQLTKGHELSQNELRLIQEYGAQPVGRGLDLQAKVIRRLAGQGEQVGGWKVAWTSRDVRDTGGIGYRPFGYIKHRRIFDSGTELTVGSGAPLAVEPEICLTLGVDLIGPEVTIDQAREAVEAVSPSFEIIERRLPRDAGLAIRLGDALGNWGVVQGPGQRPGIDLDCLAIEVTVDGSVVGTNGTDSSVLDDPYLSLARVCGTLYDQGLGLQAGQRVITGSILPPVTVTTRGGRFLGDFGKLGQVEVIFIREA